MWFEASTSRAPTADGPPPPRNAARDPVPDRPRTAACPRRAASTTSTTCPARRPTPPRVPTASPATCTPPAADVPKNTARWVVELPLASLRTGVRAALRARTTATRRTGSSPWRPGFGDGPRHRRRRGRRRTTRRTGPWPTRSSTAAPEDVPYSERYQFLGDPRHSPVRRPGPDRDDRRPTATTGTSTTSGTGRPTPGAGGSPSTRPGCGTGGSAAGRPRRRRVSSAGCAGPRLQRRRSTPP